MITAESEFFRQATLRICGSLEIGKALHQALIYLQAFMPAEEIGLFLYDPGLGAAVGVAQADAAGGRESSFKVPLTLAARRLIEAERVQAVVRTVASLEEDEAGRCLMEGLGLPDSSGLAMALVLEGHVVGRVALRARGQGRYTPEHARLLGLLNEPLAIALANCLRYQEVRRLQEILADDNRYLHDELRRLSGREIVGAEGGLGEVMALVRQVAPLIVPVLIQGETGTGKELVAAAIHRLSPRQEGPFIAVNCGAIPETLIDSELFGHERGAFTGAVARQRGRFERAHGGTIFLDEVGELPLEAQVKLLRVLQEKEVERLGGLGPIKVDLRVIAATNRDLEALVAQGRFREDLYFRLKVFPLRLPPLRERPGDVPALVSHFIAKHVREMRLPVTPGLAPGAIDRLLAYPWPGNVRELENAVERALILSQGRPLRFEELDRADPHSGPQPDQAGPWLLDEVVAGQIRRALATAQGRVEGEKGAARLLGVHPATLRHRMRRLGIPFGRRTQAGRRGGQ